VGTSSVEVAVDPHPEVDVPVAVATARAAIHALTIMRAILNNVQECVNCRPLSALQDAHRSGDGCGYEEDEDRRPGRLASAIQGGPGQHEQPRNE
jgi:hypothetical protein